MTPVELTTIEGAKKPCLFDALLYDAPFLIDKLVKERIVEDADEGRALFVEVKRFLVLSSDDRTRSWEMYSARVDEVWHQFILYTGEYHNFCLKYFGRFVHHVPSNAQKSERSASAEPCTPELFRRRYAELFGAPPGAIWEDAHAVTLYSRIINDRAGQLNIRVDREKCTLLDQASTELLSADLLVLPALGFIAATGAFHVRELLGELHAEEKIALVSSLVEHRLLRLAP